MRFSLRSLFFLMAGVAVYCALLFAEPTWIGMISMPILTLMILPVAVGGIVYTRGAWQAFWIGCTVGTGLVILIMFLFSSGIIFSVSNGDDDWQFRLIYAILHGLILINGAIVGGVRWFCTRGQLEKSAPANAETVLIEDQG